MIRILKHGHYRLIETKTQTRVLILDKQKKCAWVNADGIGEILVFFTKPLQVNMVLGTGKYRLYDIRDEPGFTDLQHLELFVGEDGWQGYLLPTGLPTLNHPKKKLIATSELITRASGQGLR